MAAAVKKATRVAKVAPQVPSSGAALLATWISPKYLKPASLRATYVKAKPFPHISLKGFLREERARALERALASEMFMKKESDLFKLSQTNELRYTSNPALREFNQFFGSKAFSDYMKAVTGVPLTNKEVDMAGFRYTDTDYLLCHDDRVTGRKIAYIVYLNQDFKEKDGGALALHVDAGKKPGKVVKRYSPGWNTFNFFTVSMKSWHTVEEVTGSKERLSIGGWLH